VHDGEGVTGEVLGRAPLALNKYVELADGTRYVWLSNFMSTDHVFAAPDSREPFVAFRSRQVMIRSRGWIRVLRPMSASHVRCLIALGWWWVAAAHF